MIFVFTNRLRNLPAAEQRAMIHLLADFRGKRVVSKTATKFFEDTLSSLQEKGLVSYKTEAKRGGVSHCEITINHFDEYYYDKRDSAKIDVVLGSVDSELKAPLLRWVTHLSDNFTPIADSNALIRAAKKLASLSEMDAAAADVIVSYCIDCNLDRLMTPKMHEQMQRLGDGEYIFRGKRFHKQICDGVMENVEVPMGAEPRPSKLHYWRGNKWEIEI